MQPVTWNQFSTRVAVGGATLVASRAIAKKGNAKKPTLSVEDKVNEAIENAAKGDSNAFKIAQSGGKHSGFFKNYLGRSPDQINKAINTLQTGKRGINVHLDKIANPSKYVPNWNTLRPGHQQSLIRGWQKEITNGREQIDILRGILGN